jgi:polyphosphate glucokinase
MDVLGIDIGGSGIKGAVIDTQTGELRGERHRLLTPKPSTPPAVAAVISEIAKHFDWHGPIGAGFPGVIRQGRIRTSANVDDSWLGVDFPDLTEQHSSCPTWVLNDADAAGVAELHYGAAREERGTVALVTVGTGLGTALFTAGQLWPNAELGHLILHGADAEAFATDRVRKILKLSRVDWAKRFNQYLLELDRLIWPDLIVIGGGASKKFKEYSHVFDPKLRIVPAELRNHAGMIGAAAYAAEQEAAACSE